MFVLSRVQLCTSVRPVARRIVTFHGLPKGWMHDEVVKFVDIVAAKVGAPAPGQGERDQTVSSTTGTSGSPAAGDASALSQSAFVKRVRIPFGRRTGVLYGDPTLELTSNEVADALLNLNFDEYSDSRRRIHFTEVSLAEYEAKERAAAVRKKLEEDEDDLALSTLDLDRFLLDPDLLFDMKKRRQRRRLTLKERINVESFREREDAAAVEEQGEIGLLGRGSAQNLGIPAPYVQGRKGF